VTQSIKKRAKHFNPMLSWDSIDSQKTPADSNTIHYKANAECEYRVLSDIFKRCYLSKKISIKKAYDEVCGYAQKNGINTIPSCRSLMLNLKQNVSDKHIFFAQNIDAFNYRQFNNVVVTRSQKKEDCRVS
jgi:hypothetical protein